MSPLAEILVLGNLKLNYWKNLYLRRKHPLNYLFWEATLNCNFNCLHCGSRASRQHSHRHELSAPEIKSVFKSIAQKTNPKKIMLAVTGGEPLLRPDLFEVMSYAHRLGFNWGMVTNGSLITPKIVHQMKQAGMSTIVVSVDGINKVHDNFRHTPGSYSKAINAIKLLVAQKTFTDVQITTVIHQHNFADLEKMYQEFMSLGINSWRVVNIDPIGRANDNPKLFLQPKQFRQMIEFISQKRAESNGKVTYSCAGFLGAKYENQVRGWLFSCPTGITTASILHNGDIFVCPNVPRIPKLIQGNVRQDNFYNVWQNKFKVFRNINRTSCLKCQKCSHWQNCLGGPFHLWDFSKNQPQICHSESLK